MKERNDMTETKLTEKQEAELRRLKSYFPYRHVYGAIKGNEWISGAVATMHQPNKLARQGYTVFKLQ